VSSRARLYVQKWRWYERNALPWRRARIHLHMLRAEAFIRFPVQGNVLESLDDGRLAIGKGTLLEPGCWITIADSGHVRIGEGCFLNMGTMVAAQERVTIGDHTMFANGCFVSDAAHRYDDPDTPITWQGFTSKGPTTIGSNCWFGVNCVVNTGVTIGDRCVIGANTKDVPAGTIAAGVPAKVIREIEFA
jgi:acetyltransferase-like isoleucine patch superfamily enzyme